MKCLVLSLPMSNEYLLIDCTFQCPFNTYIEDGHPCAQGSGYCMGGICPTVHKQCQGIWGPGRWLCCWPALTNILNWLFSFNFKLKLKKFCLWVVCCNHQAPRVDMTSAFSALIQLATLMVTVARTRWQAAMPSVRMSKLFGKHLTSYISISHFHLLFS